MISEDVVKTISEDIVSTISEDVVSNTMTKVTLGSIAGLASWFFGGLDGFFKVLLTFAVIDYLKDKQKAPSFSYGDECPNP